MWALSANINNLQLYSHFEMNERKNIYLFRLNMSQIFLEIKEPTLNIANSKGESQEGTHHQILSVPEAYLYIIYQLPYLIRIL